MTDKLDKKRKKYTNFQEEINGTLIR